MNVAVVSPQVWVLRHAALGRWGRSNAFAGDRYKVRAVVTVGSRGSCGWGAATANDRALAAHMGYLSR